MDWSILLGVVVIVYAAVILIRTFRNAKRGKCAGCPYCGDCGHQGECDAKKK